MTQAPDIKRANSVSGLLAEIANRWSPRAFADKPVENDKLHRCFEAARWAASCFNEQPWRFIVGRKGDDTYDRIFESLGSSNQEWCKFAPVLVLAVAKETFTLNGKPNVPYASHDVGQAAANFALQATHEGLQLHQMAGFSVDKARELFAIPEGYQPLTTWALGYEGNPAILSERQQAAERAPRKRKELSEIVFAGEWERPATF